MLVIENCPQVELLKCVRNGKIGVRSSTVLAIAPVTMKAIALIARLYLLMQALGRILALISTLESDSLCLEQELLKVSGQLNSDLPSVLASLQFGVYLLLNVD